MRLCSLGSCPAAAPGLCSCLTLLPTRCGDGPSARCGNGPSARCGDRPSAWCSDRPAARCGDRPSARCSDGPSVRCGDRPSVRCGDRPAAQCGDGPSARCGDGSSARCELGRMRPSGLCVVGGGSKAAPPLAFAALNLAAAALAAAPQAGLSLNFLPLSPPAYSGCLRQHHHVPSLPGSQGAQGRPLLPLLEDQPPWSPLLCPEPPGWVWSRAMLWDGGGWGLACPQPPLRHKGPRCWLTLIARAGESPPRAAHASRRRGSATVPGLPPLGRRKGQPPGSLHQNPTPWDGSGSSQPQPLSTPHVAAGGGVNADAGCSRAGSPAPGSAAGVCAFPYAVLYFGGGCK